MPSSPPSVPSVLLVDDEPSLLKVNARVLSREFAVHTVTSAESALALVLDGARFDVIFCDLTLPGMSGAELFTRLRATDLAQAARFAIVSGSPSSACEAGLVAALGERWLEKPVSPGDLRVAAARIVSRET
jgi:CheY-like chemotaxis protein